MFQIVDSGHPICCSCTTAAGKMMQVSHSGWRLMKTPQFAMGGAVLAPGFLSDCFADIVMEPVCRNRILEGTDLKELDASLAKRKSIVGQPSAEDHGAAGESAANP